MFAPLKTGRKAVHYKASSTDSDDHYATGYRDAVDFLLQVTGQSSQQKPRSANFQKDYTKENVRRMREIQAMCKRKQEEKAKPMKALWRDSKYDNVLPKVTPTHQTMTSKSSPASPLSSSSPNFVKTYSCTDIANASKTSTPHADNAKISHESKRSVRPRSSSLSRLSRSSTLPELSNNRKPSKNFIASNVEAVKNCKLKGEENLKQDNKKERAKGTIPKYLTERKLQWKEEEEKRIKELPDPSAPPGHTKLPDSEKNKTLEMLLAKQDQLLQILNKLPISAHTTGVKQRREETEKQLNEIDEGIKIFSRKVVYIKN